MKFKMYTIFIYRNTPKNIILWNKELKFKNALCFHQNPFKNDNVKK